MGIKSVAYRTISFILQLILITIPVAVLIILFFYKILIFNQLPLYVITAVLVLFDILIIFRIIPVVVQSFSKVNSETAKITSNNKTDNNTGSEFTQDELTHNLAAEVLDLSSEILSRAVPVNLPKLQGISFGAFYIPRDREGIDYFDFIVPTKSSVSVIVTETSGLHIKNAIYSVILRSAFQSCLKEANSTYSVMQKLNKALFSYSKGEDCIVKSYNCYFDISAMKIIYTNAGYQPLEIYRADRDYFESLDTEGVSLGTDLKTDYKMGSGSLLPGDVGFLYSRSLIDSKNAVGEKFELTQLHKIIKEYRSKHPSEIAGILKDSFLSFKGSSSTESNVLVIIFKV